MHNLTATSCSLLRTSDILHSHVPYFFRKLFEEAGNALRKSFYNQYSLLLFPSLRPHIPPLSEPAFFSQSTNSYALFEKQPIPYSDGRLLIGMSMPAALSLIFLSLFFFLFILISFLLYIFADVLL